MLTHLAGTVCSRRARHAAALATLTLAACKEVTVPNYNNPSVEELTQNPTASTVNTAAVGMLIALRARVNTEASAMGILGRESYNLDQAEPRNVLGYLQGPVEPGGFVQDLSWTAAYRNVLQGAVIIDAVEKVTAYTPAQREAIRGFAKTIMAIELLSQIRIRDTVGIAVDISTDPSAALPPIVGKDAALARIATLFEEAKAHLQNGGSAFPFTLHSGFTGFTTPATFLRFNRGMRARTNVYRRQWQLAFADLGESFISTSSGTAAALATGVYHVFSTASGDVANPLFDATPTRLYVHPSILSGAQQRPDGSADLRLTTKTATGAERVTATVRGTHRFTNYASQSASVPILKNEELILLRAEARYWTGDTDGALADINFIRTNSGGLAARGAFASDDDFVTELLYNRTYSLLFEGGHRWVDARRYGRLAQLPKVNASTLAERLFPYVMFPADECNQREPQPQPGCSQVPGI